MIARLNIEVRKNGLIAKRYSQPIRSFTANVIRTLYGGIIHTHSPVFRKGGGTLNANTWRWWVPTSGNMTGIIVGSGSTASTYLDIDLDTFIPHGTSADELSYNNSNRSHSFASGVLTETLSRTFTNNSGGDIIVREVALGINNNTSSYEGIALRDVLDTPVTISNGAELFVEIELVANSGASNLNSNGALWLLGMAEVFITEFVNIGGNTFSDSFDDVDIWSTGVLNSEQGIRFGTDDTAFDKDANNQPTLAGLIAPGSGAGELDHGECPAQILAEDANGGTLRLTRSVVNNSGGSITIREIGIFSSLVSGNRIMPFRYVLATPVTLNNGEGETFNIDLSMEH